jgi:hypothetical protein
MLDLSACRADFLSVFLCFTFCRKHTATGSQKQEDAQDEFDDEDKFLNLDDVLQGDAAPSTLL